jgi:hypothetical protein
MKDFEPDLCERILVGLVQGSLSLPEPDRRFGVGFEIIPDGNGLRWH